MKYEIWRMKHELLAAVRQHRRHAFEIIFGNESVNIELTFTFRRLLGQNVAGVRMPAFDLSRGGRAKTLRGPFMCFEFWHNSSQKIIHNGATKERKEDRRLKIAIFNLRSSLRSFAR